MPEASCRSVMAELAALGSEATKRIWVKHGAREPFFGVKIADLKPLAKKLRAGGAWIEQQRAAERGE